jgi:FkbM family methyltransferase
MPRHAVPGGTTRRVRIGGRDWRLAGEREDSFFRWCGQHARGLAPLARIAAAVLPPAGVAIDVGANLGLATLALAPLLPEGRIIAVEPAPRIAAALRRTVALNGLAGKVTVLEQALGAAAGAAAFHADAHSAGSHLLTGPTADGSGPPVLTVQVGTLDDLVGRLGLTRLDFIKIDVEGHETEVLDGAASTLARFRPSLFVEFNAWTLMCNRNTNPRATLEDWFARFPMVHAVRPDGPPQRLTAAGLLPFLHDHLVLRGCADDLVLGYADDWVERWR